MSDHGTNFVGADQELKNLTEFIERSFHHNILALSTESIVGSPVCYRNVPYIG